MNKFKKIRRRISEYGWIYVIKLVIRNKIYIPLDNVAYAISTKLCKHIQLKDIIIIESHNDFDSNGGAFYDYLIKNDYNKRYKIVWLLWNIKKKPEKLPYNVECIPFYNPNFKRNYYMCVAKYFAVDDSSTVKKTREEQMLIHLRHGAGGLKNVKGFGVIPRSVDYILGMSEHYAKIESDQLSINYPDKRLIFLGFPSHDYLFQHNTDELKKFTNRKFTKVILWMPTYRKGGGMDRNDSSVELPLGIPLITSLNEYKKLNEVLKSYNILLVIKLHPKQEINELKITDLSNIKVLTGETVKQLEVDNYRLMSSCDAMISDYSGAAFDYLQLNRPISYVLSDMHEYKLGFVVDDIRTLMAGHEIYDYNDLTHFIVDVAKEIDEYEEKRLKLRDYIYQYHDGDNSKRLAEFMGLKK